MTTVDLNGAETGSPLWLVHHLNRLMARIAFSTLNYLEKPLVLRVGAVILREFVFYMGHALLLYIGYAFKGIWPKENWRQGWIGVGLVHFTMAALYGIM